MGCTASLCLVALSWNIGGLIHRNNECLHNSPQSFVYGKLHWGQLHICVAPIFWHKWANNSIHLKKHKDPNIKEITFLVCRLQSLVHLKGLTWAWKIKDNTCLVHYWDYLDDAMRFSHWSTKKEINKFHPTISDVMILLPLPVHSFFDIGLIFHCHGYTPMDLPPFQEQHQRQTLACCRQSPLYWVCEDCLWVLEQKISQSSLNRYLASEKASYSQTSDSKSNSSSSSPGGIPHWPLWTSAAFSSMPDLQCTSLDYHLPKYLPQWTFFELQYEEVLDELPWIDDVDGMSHSLQQQTSFLSILKDFS